jgi:hypothetical protein
VPSAAKRRESWRSLRPAAAATCEGRVGQVLLDVGVRGGPVRGREGRVLAAHQDRHQVEDGALVRGERAPRPGGAAGNPRERTGVLAGAGNGGRGEGHQDGGLEPGDA